MALEINDINIGATATKQGKIINKCDGFAADPTVTDDSSQGWDIGDFWINTTTDEQFVCLDNSVGAAVWKSTTTAQTVNSEQPCIQARRTTLYSLTTTLTNIAFDTTEVENAPSEIDHDSVNTERIYLHTSTYYRGSVGFEFKNTATQDRVIDIELWLNDTTMLNNINFILDRSSTEMVNRDLILPPLPAGSYCTIRVKADNTGVDLQAGTVVSLNMMKGVKGDTGATGANGADGVDGADGDITWQGNWVSQNYTANQAVKYSDGSSYVCHTNTTASQVPTDTNYWDCLAEKGDTGAAGASVISLAFASQNKHGLDTASTSYTVGASLLFTGTNTFTPSVIKCAVKSLGTGNNQHVRIYDATNSQVIAENFWAESTSISIQDLGTLSNLSATPAHWEIQFRISGGADQFTIYNMTIY